MIDIQYTPSRLTYQEALMLDSLSGEPHPIERLEQGVWLCLSFTDPATSYRVDLRGAQPVCSCPAWRKATGCKHCRVVSEQAPAIEEALHQQRRAERIAVYGSEQAAANAVGVQVWGPDYTPLPEPDPALADLGRAPTEADRRVAQALRHSDAPLCEDDYAFIRWALGTPDPAPVDAAVVVAATVAAGEPAPPPTRRIVPADSVFPNPYAERSERRPAAPKATGRPYVRQNRRKEAW